MIAQRPSSAEEFARAKGRLLAGVAAATAVQIAVLFVVMVFYGYTVQRQSEDQVQAALQQQGIEEQRQRAQALAELFAALPQEQSIEERWRIVGAAATPEAPLFLFDVQGQSLLSQPPEATMDLPWPQAAVSEFGQALDFGLTRGGWWAWAEGLPGTEALLVAAKNPAALGKGAPDQVPRLGANWQGMALLVLVVMSLFTALLLGLLGSGWQQSWRILRRSQRMLEESQRRQMTLQQMADQVDSGLIMLDVWGRANWCNRALGEILARDSAACSGMALEELLANPHSPREIFIEARLRAQQEGSAQVKFRGLDQAGAPRWLRLHLSQLRDDLGNNLYVALLYDVSQERQMIERLRHGEDSLRSALSEARHASEAKERFLNNMSHEIRTPMNGVLGMLELLLESPLNPEQHDHLSTAHRSAEAMMTILNDILDFSRLEAAGLELEHISFDLRALVFDVCHLFRPRLSGSAVELIVSIDDAVPARVQGDPARLRQVLNNLLSNAVKFTLDGHILIGVRWLKDAAANQAGVEMVVADTGIGMDADTRARIFEPFTQAEASTNRRFGGTGLGLSIVRRLVELMQGRLAVDSRPAKGTSMTLTLPLGTAPDTGSWALRGARDGRGLRVLVVDDDAVSRLVIEGQLSSAGCQVQALSRAQEVLAELDRAEQDWDVLLADRHMPGMEGLELGRLVAERHQRPAMVLMSASNHRGDAGRARSAGFHGFLSKPIDQETLLGVLLCAVDHYRHQRDELATRHSIREARSEMARDEAQRAQLHGVHVLVAEDNVVNQKVARSFLSKMGCQVSVVNNGQEALDWLREQPQVDVVLLDLQMPVLDGIGTCEAIRSFERSKQWPHPPLPIIAMTGRVLDSEISQCMAVGMNGHVSKPLTAEGITRELVRVLGRADDAPPPPAPAAQAPESSPPSPDRHR